MDMPVRLRGQGLPVKNYRPRLIRPAELSMGGRSAPAAAEVTLTVTGRFGFAFGKISGPSQRLFKLSGIAARQP